MTLPTAMGIAFSTMPPCCICGTRSFWFIRGRGLVCRLATFRPWTTTRYGVPQMQQGGIVEKAMPMAVGKVMLICPRCDQPTRIRHLLLETGARIRACGHCGQPVEVKGA